MGENPFGEPKRPLVFEDLVSYLRPANRFMDEHVKVRVTGFVGFGHEHVSEADNSRLLPHSFQIALKVWTERADLSAKLSPKIHLIEVSTLLRGPKSGHRQNAKLMLWRECERPEPSSGCHLNFGFSAEGPEETPRTATLVAFTTRRDEF